MIFFIAEIPSVNFTSRIGALPVLVTICILISCGDRGQSLKNLIDSSLEIIYFCSDQSGTDRFFNLHRRCGMPRVNTVKAARKSYPEAGIRKGETYYWWKFRMGGKVRSRSYPKRSQLTQSPWLKELYDLQDRDKFHLVHSQEEWEPQVENFKDWIESLKEQAEESLENMPEHLQDTSSTGELLTERIEACENWIDELDCVDLSYEDPPEDLSTEELKEEWEEEKETRSQEIMDELEGIEYQG